MNLIGSYNYALVALSVLIAMLASYAALDLASRVTAAGGWTRVLWVLGGACAMGTGIWSMHYIGMLAFILPIPVAYHWPTVLLSLFAAMLASATALYVVSRQKMGASQAVAGSVLMGAGIAGMHYIGMAAMRLPAVCQFNSSLVLLSVAFAVLISVAALWITFHFRDQKIGVGRKKLAGAVVMGAAIPVMHYTGMAAASFAPSGMPVDLSNAVSISALGIAGIVAVTFVVLGLALLTSWVDRRFAARIFELQQQRSEAYLAEAQRLSQTGSFGWKPSTGELIWSEETFRVFQYDRTTTPTVELTLRRVHPEDAALVQQTIERATQDTKDIDVEHRLLMPDGSVKHVHVVARALIDESGSLEFVGAVMDVTAAKHVEQTLRKSEAYLAEAQRLSHTGSWASTPAMGEIRYFSEECYRVVGFDPQSGLPRYETFFDRIHPDDQAKVREAVETAGREKAEFELDYRIIHPVGEVRDIHVIGHPVFSPSGDLVEYVGTVIDITERKQAEEKLRRSEESLLEAQRLSHTGSWRRDVASGPVAVSPEIYRIFGISSDEDTSRAEFWTNKIHPEDRERVQELAKRSQVDKTDYETDYRIVLSDGAVKHLHVIGHPVLNEAGDVIEFVGSAMDVTTAKQAEEALRRSEAYLAEAQRLSQTGSWAWRSAGDTALHLSEEWYRIYGFDPEVGMPAWEQLLGRIHPDDRAKWQRTLDRAIREKSEYQIEFRILLPDGMVKYIHAVGHPVFSATGDLVEFVGSSMDITERNRAEEALRRAQADLARINRVSMMGELAASLAHELKQPIAAAAMDAKSCLRWLRRDAPDVAEGCDAALRMINDSTRAAEVIDRVRSLYTRDTSDRERLDVNEIIREMIVLLRDKADRNSISIRTRLDSDLPLITADRVQVQQVLMNLILNGIEAMNDAKGELTITSKRTADAHLFVSVSDSGIGLPVGEVDRIFDAFFTTKAQGTGMGLSISRRIIECHGGRLWASANAERGATFQFTLPTDVAASSSSAA